MHQVMWGSVDLKSLLKKKKNREKIGRKREYHSCVLHKKKLI